MRAIPWWSFPTESVTMPQRFDALAKYNAEVARGIVHTKEWDEKMAVLQADFDAWRRTHRGKAIYVREST